MEIKVEAPPNYPEICKRFPSIFGNSNILFTYGNNIYILREMDIPVWIMEHEKVHSVRQAEITPEEWWDKYLKEDDFRYNEELLAHRVEYQTYCIINHARNQRRLGLKEISKRLSSPMYGNCATFDRAKKDIKEVLKDD